MTSLLVDSHCHLNLLDTDIGIETILSEAAKQGVGYFLCVSIDLESFNEINKLASEHGNVFVSAGVHPNTRLAVEPTIEDILTVASNPNVVAIGETGLDYYRDAVDKKVQQDRFRRHIQAAKRLNKPLIIHTRDASQDVLAILREEGADTVGGVMHCFVEDWESARQAMALNFYISLSGIVTFKNALAVKEIAKKVPLDRLLVETDCPYLAPVPFRGKSNYPAYVRYVADHIAELRGLAYETVANTTTDNFFRLFANANPV